MFGQESPVHLGCCHGCVIPLVVYGSRIFVCSDIHFNIANGNVQLKKELTGNSSGPYNRTSECECTCEVTLQTMHVPISKHALQSLLCIGCMKQRGIPRNESQALLKDTRMYLFGIDPVVSGRTTRLSHEQRPSKYYIRLINGSTARQGQTLYTATSQTTA